MIHGDPRQREEALHWYYQLRVCVAERASSRVLQVLETQRTLPVQFLARQCHEAMHIRFLVSADPRQANRIGYLLRRLPSVTSAYWLEVDDEAEEHLLWQRTALASFAPFESGVDLDPTSPWWQAAPSTLLMTDNEGQRVPQHDTEVRMCWTPSSLYVLFDSAYRHLSLRQGAPMLQSATAHLWENDVAELFLGEGEATPQRYMEFEVSPRGEWIDLDITAEEGTIRSSAALHSGFEAAACMHREQCRWLAFLRVPLSPGHAEREQVLRLNLFRSQGRGPVELAWQPTQHVSFHVPSRFGYLRLLPG